MAVSVYDTFNILFYPLVLILFNHFYFEIKLSVLLF